MSHRLTIDHMRDIAEKRKGKCLSKTYVNNKKKLFWECSKGHRWEATPESVKRGTWCRTCWLKRLKKINGSKRLTIEDMHQLAKNRRGKCLSNKYINSRAHLIWECSNGHQWKARPDNIKRGHWCPRCRKRNKVNELPANPPRLL